MIIEKVRFAGGILQNETTDQLFSMVRERIRHGLQCHSTNEDNFLSLRGECPFVKINSKNIEGELTDSYRNHPMAEWENDELRKRKIYDIVIYLTIYRLGNNSYWVSDIEQIHDLERILS